MFNIIEFRLNVSIQLFEIVLKIPPNLPLPKGGENYPPFDKGGLRGIRYSFSKR